MKKIFIVLIFSGLINFAFSQNDSLRGVVGNIHKENKINDFKNHLSIYVMPFSIFDLNYRNARFGFDYLINDFFKIDLDFQYWYKKNPGIYYTYYHLPTFFYGNKLQLKYLFQTKKSRKKEFSKVLGLELFYNKSTNAYFNHYYHLPDNYAKVVYYEQAKLDRNKYGLNIFFSFNNIYNRFYFEPYAGIGLAFTNFKYYDVIKPLVDDMNFKENDYNNSFKYPGKNFIMPNIILGIKIGVTVIKKYINEQSKN